MNVHYYEPHKADQTGLLETDIAIFGATSAGIVAAVQVRKMGKRVVLLEAGGHLGGMTTGGLSRTDSGNKRSIGGLSRAFYEACGKHYGQCEEWKFEPHVASAVFREWLGEADVPVYVYQYLKGVVKEGNRITELVTENGLRVRAKLFIDCSYEGDLMAASGVSYHVGREGNARYGELYNGNSIAIIHQFDRFVDPYRIPGDPASGLLPGIDDAPPVDPLEGDARIQAYNFRLCLSNDPANRIPFEKPAGYNEEEYELLARYFKAGWVDELIRFDPIQGNKVDMNNHGAFSTDYIGANDRWPDGSYAEREVIFQNHLRYQKGLMWFRSNSPKVPLETREKIRAWGLAADEFTETGGWPPQLYIREARRMQGEAVITDHYCLGIGQAEEVIALGTYQMDSHNCRRLVYQGRVLNEGDVQARVHPYGIPWQTILPRREEVENLLVPVCLSASHIAFGSIRMEPVFMILGQSAATAAVLALEEGCPLHDLPYEKLRTQLERDGQVLKGAPSGRQR